MGRTAPLTSKSCILYIYSTNIGTEYFKHAPYSPFFSLQNAVCFIMLTCLVPVLFAFYIQDVVKLKKNYSSIKGLIQGVVLLEVDIMVLTLLFICNSLRTTSLCRNLYQGSKAFVWFILVNVIDSYFNILYTKRENRLPSGIFLGYKHWFGNTVPETSVKHFQHTLRNNPEERRLAVNYCSH